ncbi:MULTISPECIES: DUF6063 family protein [Halanaerobium]|jgi:hypothetical protein|uniref:Uncharacterized protein n=1 Tax=Halanaerobium kushneri TaxID=56779 RepID=A0A1N6VL38_9FIRM|nr:MULTISPECIES: DUF6063 family protein [Halanaerobium]RCW56498.1 hypothetical protein DFR80_11410 [Halanaerobium sp. ST460_2HS_T2]SIQ78507.1 hypothetical protein SAMN05421834_10843 [Halanaerobium kushneri]
MAFNQEELENGSALFFKLLEEQIISVSDPLAEKYRTNSEVHNIVNTMAAEAGLRVFSTAKNVHLVSKARGSSFANSYTQMKQKKEYSGLKRKRYFYLANIIISIFLAEVDKESHVRIRWEEEGISYHRLSDLVTSTLESWLERKKEEDSFTQNWSIAVEEVAELWLTEFSEYRLNKEEKVDVTRTKGNRLSFINTALKPLTEQGLIIDQSDELKLIPKAELYERLDELYHSQKRYNKFMDLILESRNELEEEDEHAQTEQN